MKRLLPMLLLLAASSCRWVDTEQARRYACQPSSTDSSQCPGPWRCGIDGFCHALTPGPYACQQDSDCEGGWRCGLEGTCVDASGEALRADAYYGALDASVVSPIALSSKPVAFGTYSGGSNYGPVDVYSFVPEGGRLLIHAIRFLGGISPGGDAGTVFFQSATHSFGGTVTEIATDPDEVRVLDSLGRVFTSKWTLGQPALGPPVQIWADAGALGEIRAFPEGPTGPFAMGLDPTQFLPPLGIEYAGDVWVSPSFPAIAAGADVAAMGDGISATCPVSAETWMYTADVTPDAYDFMDDGGDPSLDPVWLVTELAEGSSWVGQIGLTCGCGLCPLSHRVQRVHPLGNSLLAFEIQVGLDEISPGDPVYSMLLSGPSPGPFKCDHSDFCSGHMPGSVAIDACLPCPGLAVPLDVRPSQAGGVNAMEAICPGPPDGGTAQTWRIDHSAFQSASDCPREPLTTAGTLSFDAVSVVRNDPANTSVGGAHGQLWTGPDVSTARSLVLDRVPDFAIGTGTGLVAFSGGEWARVNDTIGLVNLVGQSSLTPGGAIDGTPGWVVTSQGSVLSEWADVPNAATAVAQLDPSSPTLSAPFRGLLLRTSDGGSEVVVAAADLMLGADVTATLDGGATASLQVKAVPFPELAILSMAPAPAPDGGALLALYVLDEAHLFSVVAKSQNTWQSTELSLPGGIPVAVFDDEGRGRLVQKDGTVFSLPSRVPLAPPAPDSTGNGISSAAQVCGAIYVVDEQGMFQLASTAGASEGTWVPVSLPASFDAASLPGAQLRGVGNELEVFGRFGTVVRMTAPSCP